MLSETICPSKIAVIISAWEGNSPELLTRLIRSMNHYKSGISFDLYLVINGSDYCIPEELKKHIRQSWFRENVGFNLGAWDYGWRKLDAYDYFLFLQDDCYVQKKNWLKTFYTRFKKINNCGMLGEHFMDRWNKSWSVLCGEKPSHGKSISANMIDRAKRYRGFLSQWSYPLGDTAAHLTTVVLFASRQVLTCIDGFKVVKTKEEAIAVEIGTSRKVVNAGFSIHQIARQRHVFVGHPQWPTRGIVAKLKKFFHFKEMA